MRCCNVDDVDQKTDDVMLGTKLNEIETSNQTNAKEKIEVKQHKVFMNFSIERLNFSLSLSANFFIRIMTKQYYIKNFHVKRRTLI